MKRMSETGDHLVKPLPTRSVQPPPQPVITTIIMIHDDGVDENGDAENDGDNGDDGNGENGDSDNGNQRR